MEGRCMKCKQQQEMVEVSIVLVTNGTRKTRMAKGKCIKCGCKMCRILPADGAVPASPKKTKAKAKPKKSAKH